MDATRTGQKMRWGKLAYLANALGQTGTIRNVAHKITLDGVVTETEAAQVFIANFGKMLPFVAPRQPIEPDDGLLDVIVVRASGPLPGLLASWEAMRQEDLGESDGGHVFRAPGARSAGRERVPSASWKRTAMRSGKTPIVATIRPGALRVIVAAQVDRRPAARLGAPGIAPEQGHRSEPEHGRPDQHAHEPDRIEGAAEQREPGDRGDAIGRHERGDVLHHRRQQADRDEQPAEEREDARASDRSPASRSPRAAGSP